MIVAPAKAGKTMVLQAIAEGVSRNYPEAQLLILLVDERPEEVFEIEAGGFGEVVASTFDHPADRHVAVAELTLERARRRVELGEDVVLIVDSLTRLARAYNTVERGTGRTLSGGLDAQSLEKPKRFLGSARRLARCLRRLHPCHQQPNEPSVIPEFASANFRDPGPAQITALGPGSPACTLGRDDRRGKLVLIIEQ